MLYLRRARCAFWLTFICLVGVSQHDCISQSQSPLASVSGTVFDPSGARIPRAAVRIQSIHLSRDLATDGEGHFSVQLPVGDYQLSITAKGFAAYSGPLSLTSAATAVHLELPMAIEVRPEEIAVPVDDAADTSGAANASALVFQGAQLDAFSNDDATFQKEIAALAGAIPGKSPIFIVDGFTGGRVPPKSSIVSVRINRNPYSALYDTFGTNRIEIATRAGTEKFHGQVNLNATDSPLNSPNPYITVAAPPYFVLNLDGNLSGPIDRKTFFALSVVFNDQQNNAALNAITASNGSPVSYSLAVRDPQTVATYALRMDRQLTPTNLLTGRYEFNQVNQTNGGLAAPLTLASQAFDSGFTTQTLRLSDTQSVGSHFISDAHLQYIRSRQRQDALSSAPSLLVEGAFNGGSNPQQSLRDNQDNFEFQESISIDRGTHYLRFGARYRLTRDANLSTANYNGQYTFSSIDSYIANQPSLYSQTVGQRSFSVLTGDLGAWAEDEWHAADNLTLDLGLRLESQSALPDHLDLAPRFGAAWAIHRKKQSTPFITLRPGVGLFYNRFAAANILTTVRQNGVSQQTFELSNPCYDPSGAPPTTGACPALSALSPTPYRIDPNFKAEYGWLAGVSVEKIIPRFGTVSVRYLAIRGVHQSDSLNINAPLPGTFNPAVPGSGVRPLGGSQNIYEFASNGISKAQILAFNSRLNLTKRANVFVSYNFNHQNQDVIGATTFASNSYNVSQDYGRAPLPRQQFFTGGTLQLPVGISLNAFASVAGGIPFNITTGTDLNGDTLYNDRPAFATHPTAASVLYATRYGTLDANPQTGEKIVPMNYGNSPSFYFLDLSASRSFQIGPRPAAPVAAPGAKTAPPPDRPYAITFTVDAYNVLNAHNPGQPVGVLSSTYFGQSVSLNNPFGSITAGNRIIYLQAQFSF
jgi:hypothetical protein